MGTRQDLADAASSVAGVHVDPYYAQHIRPGSGLVQLAGLARDDSGFGYMETWRVLVVLPQQFAAAEAWIETNVDALLEALEPHLIVTTVTPSELLIDSSSLPVLSIEGARAH